MGECGKGGWGEGLARREGAGTMLTEWAVALRHNTQAPQVRITSLHSQALKPNALSLTKFDLAM